MTTFAYLRVSSALQASANGTDAQRHSITQWLKGQGIEPEAVRWFQDLAVSGKSMDRPQWLAMNQEIQGGDLVVCYSLSRAGRNLSGLSAWVNDMVTRGVRVRFVKEDIDVSTINGRLVMHLMGAIAEWAREEIREKTGDGIKAKIARGEGWAGSLPCRIGKKGGRRFTDEEEEAIRAEHRAGVSAWELHKRHGSDYRTMKKLCEKINA